MSAVLTEAEAKQRWCPFTFAAAIPAQGEHPPWPCCTVNCMAWQPHESPGFKNMADAEFRKTGKRIKPTEGYCSLMRTAP